MTEKATLVRDHPVTDELTVYTATATFVDGEDEDYTYHKKRVENGTIILYTYDISQIRTRPTDYHKTAIESKTGDHYYEKIPVPPQLTYPNRIEEARISPENRKDFNISRRDTQEVTYHNWSAAVDMPKDAALAYYHHIGEDKCRIT